LACHAPNITARQRAKLFVRNLLDHIRVDVEMREPVNLQSAMYYTRAFEQRALAMQQAFPARGAWPPPRPTPPALGQVCPALPLVGPFATPVMRPFRRLTIAEQLERHRKGLCFNCDEPFTPGHVCPLLFYLETIDDVDVDAVVAELEAATRFKDDGTAQGPVQAKAFVVSLHALTVIQWEETMLLPVTINSVRLIALLDSGSTHNFLSVATMHRLGLQLSGAEQLSVTVANGDHLACQGMAW
jgi:hypothetical protein